MYQSAVTVRLSSKGMVATRPDFLKKQETVFFCATRDILSFGVMDSSVTADCTLVSESYRQIQVLSPVSTSQVNFGRPPFSFRNMTGSSVKRVGDPPCTSHSDTKMIVQCGHGHCRSDAKDFAETLEW